MHYPLPPRHAKLIATVLFAAVAVSGCSKKEQYKAYTCSDVKIKLDPSKQRGVDHKAVYLCANNVNTITWVPEANVKSFRIEFIGHDLPFGSTTTFVGTTSPVTTPPLPDPGELTVFKYDLTIVDTNGKIWPFDPHVVGGGGLVTYLSSDLK